MELNQFSDMIMRRKKKRNTSHAEGRLKMVQTVQCLYHFPGGVIIQMKIP